MATHNDAVVLICAATIRDQIADEPDLEKRILKAFRLVQDFWMSTDDDVRMRGALAAVVQVSTEPERDRIAKTMNVLRALGAAIAGVPVDMAAAMDALEGAEPLPIMRLWLEAKGEA